MFDENGKLIGEENNTQEAKASEAEKQTEVIEEKIEETKAEAVAEDSKEEPLHEEAVAEEAEKEPLHEEAVAEEANKEPLHEEAAEIPRVKKPAENNRMYEQKAQPKKKSGVFKKILLTGVCAALAGIVFSVSAMWAMYITEEHSPIFSLGVTKDASTQLESTETTLLNYPTTQTRDGEMAIEDIVEACIPSVVSITNKGVSEVMTFFGNYQTESISSGSGIIIGENDTELLIVTNYHVVADSKELTVVFSHEEAEAQSGDDSYLNVAQVKGYDESKDIAVIAVKLSEISNEAKKQIKIAVIGNSDDIKPGSGVVAIGNALGYGQSVTHGIVSALNREVTMQGVKGGTITNAYIQTDAAINSGNSGGALLNMQGQLIGINSAKISSTGVEGMGYAIPISDVEELIGELMSLKTREVVEEAKRGYLGIYGIDVTSTDNQKYGMPIGVFVQSTIENSPADKSELEQGDIIVAIDGLSVSNMSSLQDRLSYYEAGEKITLKVKRLEGRKYKEAEVEVVLGSKNDAGIE